MKGADIALGWINSTGQLHLEVRIEHEQSVFSFLTDH